MNPALSHVLSVVALACLVMPTALPPTAQPPIRCACCADSGTWDQTTRRVTPEEFAEIGRVNLSPAATTAIGPGGLEIVKGIASPAEAYQVTHRRPTRDWRLELQDRAGHKGEIRFTIPDRATFFMADIQDDVMGAVGGPVLYKEWRLSGPAVGTGAFRGGTFRLILQGRGNVCPNADDFKTWILQVEGPGVDYSLFGRLAAPRQRAGADAMTIPPASVAAPPADQDDKVGMTWERGLALEDEFLVQIAMVGGLDPARADQVRRIFLDARASLRLDAAKNRAGEMTTSDLGMAAVKQRAETDRRLATVLTPNELTRLYLGRDDAHTHAVAWLRLTSR